MFESSEIANKLAFHKFPRYDELPTFDIFMTQLTDILEGYLSVFKVPGEEKILTSSMINNYVFKHVITPPVQKKYNKEQVAHLLIIGILKQVLSINDIAVLIANQKAQYPIDIAYNYFCEEVENALRVTFNIRNFAEIEKTQPTKITPLTKKVRSAVLSFANKIYVKQCIYYENTNTGN